VYVRWTGRVRTWAGESETQRQGQSRFRRSLSHMGRDISAPAACLGSGARGEKSVQIAAPAGGRHAHTGGRRGAARARETRVVVVDLPVAKRPAARRELSWTAREGLQDACRCAIFPWTQQLRRRRTGLCQRRRTRLARVWPLVRSVVPRAQPLSSLPLNWSPSAAWPVSSSALPSLQSATAREENAYTG